KTALLFARKRGAVFFSGGRIAHAGAFRAHRDKDRIKMRRVVVTGMGIISPLGQGLDHNWQAITAGASGIGKIAAFDASDIPSRIAGEVPAAEAPGGFDVNKYIEPKEQK